MGVCPACQASSGAWAQPAWGLPAEVLEALRLVLQAQLPRSTDVRWVPRGPGPCDQRPAGLGMPGGGARALVAALTRGLG